MKWRATRVIYRSSWLTGESGAAFSRPMSQHRRGDASSVWLMERDLRQPGGWEERGATWSVTFNGYSLNMPPLNEASDLYLSRSSRNLEVFGRLKCFRL